MKYIKAHKRWQNENNSIVILCRDDGARIFFPSDSHSEHLDAFNNWIAEGNELGNEDEYDEGVEDAV